MYRRLAITAVLSVTSCTSSQIAQIPTVNPVNPASSAKLQLAVGTATIGTANGGTVQGLNVVATFRGPGGNNATNTNTPTITAPPDFSFGPLLGNSNVLTGFNTKQYVDLENAYVAGQNPAGELLQLSQGLGPFIGVFGYGLAADNRFALDDSQIQGKLLGIIGNEGCEGMAFPGYIDEATAVPTVNAPGSAVNQIAPYGPLPGIYYGGSSTALGSSGPFGRPLTTSAVAALERSAELALPIPSGPGQNCSCPQKCAPDGTPLNDANFPIQAFGGPPAWPSPQGYGNYKYFVGYPLGFTDFGVPPVLGTYALSVTYPTSTDYRSTGSLSTQTQLSNLNALPALSTPKLTVDPDGSGVLSAWTVPPGVSEAIVLIATQDCDLGGRSLTTSDAGFNHYAFVVHSSGPQPPIFIAPDLGPPGLVTNAPSHTFCTTSDIAAEQKALAATGASPQVNTQFVIQVQAIGFDYPAYESSYPFTMSQTPLIHNPAGQADVTTSYPQFATFNVPLPPTTTGP